MGEVTRIRGVDDPTAAGCGEHHDGVDAVDPACAAEQFARAAGQRFIGRFDCAAAQQAGKAGAWRAPSRPTCQTTGAGTTGPHSSVPAVAATSAPASYVTLTPSYAPAAPGLLELLAGLAGHLDRDRALLSRPLSQRGQAVRAPFVVRQAVADRFPHPRGQREPLPAGGCLRPGP